MIASKVAGIDSSDESKRKVSYSLVLPVPTVPKTQVRPMPTAARITCSAKASQEAAVPMTPAVTRRSLLQAGAAVVAAPLFTAAPALAAPTPAAALPAAAAPATTKPPKGFNPVKDGADGYSFVYPFGWQEVAVKGQDVVYKDVIEPLESVSVSYIPTDKTSIAEFGDLTEVTETLAKEVLTNPAQEAKVVSSKKVVKDGREYYEFEFTSKSRNFVKHALAVVTVGNGKFYTLTTGSNERRWGKMKDRLETVVGSFTVTNVF